MASRGPVKTTVTTTVTTKTSSVAAPVATGKASELQKYVKGNLSIEKVQNLKEFFDIFDMNKGGTISPDEFITAIKALNMGEQANAIIEIVKRNSGQDELDFQGFLDVFGFNNDSKSETTTQGLFEAFDFNGQGFFGVEEFSKICQDAGETFTENEIANMIAYADKDKDGVINYADFVEIVTKEYPKV